jgi:hypothetical protein
LTPSERPFLRFRFSLIDQAYSKLSELCIHYSRRTLKERVEEYEVTILDYPIEQIAIEVIDWERLPKQATKITYLPKSKPIKP